MLKTRIITALVLVAAFLPTLFMSSNMVWAVITLGVMLLALYEWGVLIGLKSSSATIFTAVFAVGGGVLLKQIHSLGFHWFFYQSILLFMVALVFWVFVVPILLSKFVIIRSKPVLMFVGLILLMPLWMTLVSVKAADHPLMLLALLTTIWIADTAAYFAGKAFGKHKLAPSISPGKTWEGVLGALLAVTLFAAVLYSSSMVTSWLVFPLLWMIAILGIVGDLFESLIKRQVDKKDSGNLLPGHGGILDRIDGVIPSLPIAVLMIYLFNYFQVAG